MKENKLNTTHSLTENKQTKHNQYDNKKTKTSAQRTGKQTQQSGTKKKGDANGNSSTNPNPHVEIEDKNWRRTFELIKQYVTDGRQQTLHNR